MADLRNKVVAEAKRAVASKEDGSISWEYSEGTDRLNELHTPWAKHITCDCSAFLVMLFVWLGLRNPDGSAPPYYTGTELTHGKHLSLLMRRGKPASFAEIVAGCAVVYGPYPGWHTAIIVEVRGRDILTVSMGGQGDPSYVWASTPLDGPSFGYPVDGRLPQTFLKFNTKKPSPVHRVVRKVAAVKQRWGQHYSRPLFPPLP